MKTICFLFCLFSITSSFSQDIKLKKGQVLVDDIVWMNYEGCGGFSQFCSLKLSKNNEEVIFMNFQKFDGVEPITNYNKDGSLSYIEIKFLGLNTSIEIKDTFKKIVAILYNSKCINEDGNFDEDKVLRLQEKYGSPFSAKLNQLKNSSNSNNNTIIIKEEPTRSNGININLGR